MWVFTERGFYSVVQKPGSFHSDILTVRARVRQDLVRLCLDLQADPDREIHDSPPGSGADYPYRMEIHRDDFALWLSRQIYLLSYANFKARVLSLFGSFRERVYHRVWTTLFSLETANSGAEGGNERNE
jgi:hypothetical protein